MSFIACFVIAAIGRFCDLLLMVFVPSRAAPGFGGIGITGMA